MQFVVFILVLWICILATQIFVLSPLDLGHLVRFPSSAALLLSLGVFAWLFGE